MKTHPVRDGGRLQRYSEPKKVGHFLPIFKPKNDAGVSQSRSMPPLDGLRLKDQRQFMEQPYFSVQKRKRVRPIEFESPDESNFVKIEGIPTFGIATIWDADILIWAASMLNDARERGQGTVSPTLCTTPYDLLKALGRGIGGKAYRELQAALVRLQSTSIFMSARASDRVVKIGFNWIDEWRVEEDPGSGRPRGVAITLSDRVFQSILAEKSLLTLDPAYLRLSGGIERALYRVIRKHAGLQRGGWLCRLELLRQKIGSESSAKEFGRMIREIVQANQLPGYQVELVCTASGQPALQCRLRGQAEHDAAVAIKQEHHERSLRIAERQRHMDRMDRAMEAGGR